VTFSQRYPAWRELFNDLLPAHIVKDVPGGFAAGLARALPVTGRQFRVETIDPQRDEILLARNDRYWGTPARPDQILFRRAGSPAALADSIRNGDTQVAQVHGGAAAYAQLSAIPEVRTDRLNTPRAMELTLRGERPSLADPAVRKAILSLLDVELLAAVGSGTDNSVVLDQALVRAPSDPGYEPTAPPALSREAALSVLAEAGYQREEDPPEAAAGSRPPGAPAGRLLRNGLPLTLVVGVAANDPTSVAVANTAADQLRGAGVAASVLPLDPPTLYGPALETDRIDAIVGWHPVGGDLATALASRFGCPALEAAPIPTTPAQPATSRAPATSGPPGAVTTSPAPDATPLIRAPSNLTGVCDRRIQPQIDGALDGSLDVDAVIAAVEPRLWAMASVLPIMQDNTIVAVGPTVANVNLTGPIPIGIVGNAGSWVKKPR